jgi:hypothetical protein
VNTRGCVPAHEVYKLLNQREGGDDTFDERVIAQDDFPMMPHERLRDEFEQRFDF